jgi:peptide/nickel transport system permease protein
VTLAVVVVSATLIIGMLLGGIAAMVGGKLDEYMMRIVDVFQSVPALILALAIAGTLGPSFRNVTLALILAGWTDYARLVRGEILKVKSLEFVEAAYSIGDKRPRVFLREVLPNTLTPIVVLMTLDAGKVVLAGATLSFVGLAEAGLAEWGNLVAAGQGEILAGRWWAATFGGAMVFLWALAANLFGDGLRDVLDPRSERR